jgi:hypothetical protein
MTVAFHAAAYRSSFLEKTWFGSQRDFGCGVPMSGCSMERLALFVFEASADAEISIDLDLRSLRPGFGQYGYDAEQDEPESHP